MDVTEIIRKGIVTEKSMHLQKVPLNQQRKKPSEADQTHKYVFQVHIDANKIQIRQAVEELFPDVTVLSVNTMRMPGKSRTFRTQRGAKQSVPREWKKAIVTVRANETITQLQA